MRIYNNYIVSLVLVACLVNILLTFFGQNDLEVYFILNILAYLVITLLHTYLNLKARKALYTIDAIFFISLMVIVALKVTKILLG